MAKARSGNRPSASAENSDSGELEPRRGTTSSGGVRRGTATSRSKSRIALPDERVVSETDKTVPVNPSRPGKRAKEGPTAGAAIDRRKQFTGTDERAKDRR